MQRISIALSTRKQYYNICTNVKKFGVSNVFESLMLTKAPFI